jgi:hypothetical protein
LIKKRREDRRRLVADNDETKGKRKKVNDKDDVKV